MLGWLFGGCPVDPAAKEWIEERLLWLRDEFGADDLSGQAHPWGTVILSAPALCHSFRDPDDAYHVGFHEFAHLLDLEQSHFDGIVFTGSFDVGFRLYKSFSTHWPRPCIVEMGGKNPAIVSRRADLEAQKAIA